MSLDTFPAELLHLVCNNCSKKDIGNLRLTSRYVGAVADEHFLPNATIFYLREEFEMIEKIVKNPRIAKNLREVHFQADRLPWCLGGGNAWLIQRMTKQMGLLDPRRIEAELEDQQGLTERQQRQRRRDAVRRRVPQSLNPKEAEKIFSQLHSDQAELMMEDRAQTCMKRLFDACPKLDKVTVAMLHPMHDALSGATPWHTVSAFQQMQITPYRDDDSSRIAVRPLNETLIAACRAGRNLKSVRVSPISYQFFDQDEETMAELHSAISNLESVHIALNDDFRHDLDEAELDERMQQMEDDGMSVDDILDTVEEDDFMAAERVLEELKDGRVAKFLHQAPRLRDITLEGPEVDYRVDADMMRLEDLVGSNPPWEKLESLKLSNFSCHWRELVLLILRNRETLQHLSIRVANIDVEGDWRRMWTSIAGKMPNIKTVKLSMGLPDVDGRCHYTAPGETSILEDFIMTGRRPTATEG